jgi:ABC-type branched-subunit amino acid transport system ATPase component
MIAEVPAPTYNGVRQDAEAPVLLRAEGLRKAFGGQVVLDGVTVELRRGQVVLLRGENGSGKTTLLNILTGNLEPDAGAIHYLADGSPRTYRFPRRWWQELNPFDHFVPEFVAREGMGRTWQDVRLFGSQTLRENITVAEPGHPGENPLMALITPARSASKEKQLRDHADTVLARFGLAGREDSSADKISLGQSKRVAIARAVAAGAKILFLDEPLAGLDRQGIDDVLGLLKTLVRDHTLTLVIVEHVFNQPHLHDLVTTDWLLESGKLKTSARSALHQSAIHYQQSSIPPRPPWFHLLAGDNAEIIDEPLPRGAMLTRIRRPDRYNPASTPALEIRDLVVKRGPRIVISGDSAGTGGMNLSLQPGETAILQAPNGWGKSTLVAAICGQLSAAGSVSVFGSVARKGEIWTQSERGLIALPASGTSFPALTIRELLTLRRSHAVVAPRIDPSRCLASLSGGEKQLLLLNVTLSSATHCAHVFVLDEPFAGLDAIAIAAAAELVRLSTDDEVATLILVPSAQHKEEGIT